MDFREFSRSCGVQDRQIDRQIDRWKDLREFGTDRQTGISGDSGQIEKMDREKEREIPGYLGSQEVQDRQMEESQGIWDRPTEQSQRFKDRQKDESQGIKTDR